MVAWSISNDAIVKTVVKWVFVLVSDELNCIFGGDFSLNHVIRIYLESHKHFQACSLFFCHNKRIIRNYLNSVNLILIPTFHSVHLNTVQELNWPKTLIKVFRLYSINWPHNQHVLLRLFFDFWVNQRLSNILLLQLTLSCFIDT